MSTPDWPVHRFDDMARVDELHRLVQSAFRDLPIDPSSSVLKETVANVTKWMQSETCFVVDVDGCLIGSVFCARQDHALYIGRLAVAPGWRRRGVASALVDAAGAEARRIGATRMTLEARIMLSNNIALFRRHGFVVTAEETHTGFSAPTSYAMELTLA